MTDQGELFHVAGATEPRCWVYLIGVPGRSVAKIGIAMDTTKRLAGLQTSHPERLAVLWRTPGGRDLEIALHAHFGKSRLRGEWFEFGDEDPVTCIRAAYEEITGLPPVEPPPPSPANVEVPGVPVDRTRPPEGDPDRDDPLYEVDDCGCRQFTPSECAAMGYPANSLMWGPVAPRKPGTLACDGRH